MQSSIMVRDGDDGPRRNDIHDAAYLVHLHNRSIHRFTILPRRPQPWLCVSHRLGPLLTLSFELKIRIPPKCFDSAASMPMKQPHRYD
jgi:hypothetical protein